MRHEHGYREEIEKARNAVLTVKGESLKTDLETRGTSFDKFLEAADYAVVEDAYRRAGRAISPDLARTYSDFLAQTEGNPDDIEESLDGSRV